MVDLRPERILWMMLRPWETEIGGPGEHLTRHTHVAASNEHPLRTAS
jgi:hypothetical protein